MIRRRQIIAGILIVASTNARAQAPKAPRHQIGRRFVEWIAASGLREAVEFVEEEESNGGYSLTLHSGHLSMVVGSAASEKLCGQLFLKLLASSGVRPDLLNLKVLRLEGGYCDPAVYETTFVLLPSGIQRTDRRTRERRGLRCMLDFESIRRYESALVRDHAQASTKLEALAGVELHGVAAASIKQILQKRYSERGATVAFLGDAPAWFNLQVTKLRSEVISTHRFWERLQVMVFLETLPVGTRIRLILDGKYAAGLAPPDDNGYSDMEPTYTAQLLAYGKQLAIELAR
ncbi:MAG: hypothetical protein ACO1PB_18865 [Ramlibacter sp.]